jgi:predicted nucleotidyltransferase
MNKVYVLLIIILCSINLIYGQSFTDTNAGLPGVQYSSIAWGDYDNDGDLDVLLTGSSSSGLISKIYRNDNSIFTEINAGLIGVEYSSVAWGDYDNDGYLDILLTGLDSTKNRISKIYRNNSNGIFTEINAGLTGVAYSSVAWGDYDNDGDLDILLTGYYTFINYISKVYRNDSGTFTDINAGLTGVTTSSVVWGDYDNDGYLDILLTGYSTTGSTTKIYHNNGNGTFTDINAGLTGVYRSSVVWGDYDNDGYLDILLTGNSTTGSIAKIYRNNANGTFTDINAGLTGVIYSSVVWGDFDNDGDLDILLTGCDVSKNPISEIYCNNGDGTFTEINTDLTEVYSGSVAWVDYNNDGDLDFQLTGHDASNNSVSKIYSNNNPVTNTVPQVPAGLSATVTCSSVQFNWDKATDNETPQDGLSYNLYIGSEPGSCDMMSPMSDISTGYRKIVRNGNADQNFVWNTDSLAEGTYFWSVQAIDHAFAGSEFAPEQTFTFKYPPVAPIALSANSIAKTSFTANWVKVEDAEGYFIDVSKDVSFTSYVSGYNNLDVGDTLSCVVENLSAFTDYFYRVRAYKINNNPSLNSNVISLKTLWDKFSDIAAGLPDVYCSSAAWGDYDNDGDLDFLLSGLIGDYDAISKIYRNDSGSFIDTGTELPGVVFGSVAWGDYDNDGDLDFLLTGKTVSNAITKIYRNDSGSFADIEAGLPGVNFGSVAWGDYDKDGDLDILLTGEELSGKISRIYRNDNGSFNEINAGLPGICYSSVAWGDYDNDSDLDILMSGDTGSGFVSRVYRNDSGVFIDIGGGLPGVRFGSVAWGDYDNDSDLDILLSGDTGSGFVSRVYRNDSGVFIDIGAGLLGVYYSAAAWGDYDNDGDLDILLSGCFGLFFTTRIYRNDSGIFVSAIGLPGVDMGAVDWGDYDNDNDLDILISGEYSYFNGVSKVYRNNSLLSNTIPNSPSNLTTSYNDSTVTFSWDKATDNETPQDALSYNFYLGTQRLAGNLNSAMSDTETGFRNVVQLGNAQQNTSYTLNRALPNGKYYWSVQAIDHTFAGSDFAPEKSFAILSSPQNVQIKHAEDYVKLTWNEVPGAQMYYVYASDDPESEFINVSKQGIFNGTTWTQTISSVKKFYYVVAVIK